MAGGPIQWDEWQAEAVCVCQAPVAVQSTGCTGSPLLSLVQLFSRVRNAMKQVGKGSAAPEPVSHCPECLRPWFPQGSHTQRGLQGRLPRLAFARSWRAFALHFLPRILEDTDPNVTLWDLAYTQTSLGSCTGGGSWACTVHAAG